MLDRTKVIDWWIGRISDPELAEWSGLSLRNIQYINNLPSIRHHISGGGRGSKASRRIPAKIRNIYPVIASLNAAGLPLETSANIIGTFFYLPGKVQEAIDFSPFLSDVRSLMMTDPDGGYLPTDIVPDHIAGGLVWVCKKIGEEPKNEGDFLYISIHKAAPKNGRMTDPTGAEFELMKPDPVYYGEVDPFGALLPSNSSPEKYPWDEYLAVVDSRFIFHQTPETSGREILQSIAMGQFGLSKTVKDTTEFLAEIASDGKSIVDFGHTELGETQRAVAEYAFRNYKSKLQVNLSMPVRTMKRLALGLPVHDPRNDTRK